MTESTKSLEPGTCFEGRFDVLEELGVGGFGRIVKARQRSTGQEVAVKILRAQERDAPTEVENHLARLRQEMRLCAALAHPHIVRLIDSGESPDGLLYVVFEYAPGETLRQVLEHEGRLEASEAFRLMSQVLDALSCAHAQGIVHRDVKPENIMVTKTGVRRNALVLDFGLGGFFTGASDAAVRTRLTAAGEIMGTPSYAAPEQLRGAPPSPESDLYSWGLVLLECLTGEMAMSGRTGYEVLMRQLGPDPIPMPEWLERQRPGQLIRSVTAKDPTQRRMPVPALLEALEAIQRDVVSTSLGQRGLGSATEGERRQLTAVSCNAAVTGTDVELEDLDHALKAHEALCLRLARDAGGTVVRAQPGEVQVAFGYPRVRENDARRAVRMALRIVAEATALANEVERARHLRLHTRLGVHSGRGIVRKIATTGGDGPYEIVGGPPQLAAKLLEQAGPDEVLVTADTRALLREEMECELVRELKLPEHTARLPVFRIVRERPATLLDTLGRVEETPLAGRAGELAHLEALWQQAQSAQASVAFIQGEAGIGKSRLMRELWRGVPREEWISCRCTAEGQASALHPLVEWLGSIAEPIDRLLAQHGLDVAENLPLLASLLSVPVDDPAMSVLSPERQRELTLSLVVSLVTRLARSRPLIFVVEDLHWADPTTLEFVRALVNEVGTSRHAPAGAGPRILAIFTARSEFKPGWSAEGVNVLSLARLSPSEVAEMVHAASKPGTPTDVVSQIADRSDGIPLFVEEMVHTLRDTGARAIPDGHEIPGTLWELLATRLDTLSASAREAVQFAAALGREFRYDLLHAALRRDEWLVRQDLAELLDARLVFGRRAAVEERYVFRHALVRDAAYESMVRSTRQRVHRRIAEAIRTHLAALGERQPELMALHLEEGGELDGAAEWWQRAGDRAFRHAAYLEAVQHLERGLSVLSRLPQGPERARREIETLIILGTVLLSTRGHADPEVGRAFSRARALCEEHGVEVSLKILANLVAAHLLEGDRDATEAFLPRFERLATETDDPVARLSGILPLAIHAFWRGEHTRAAGLLDEARSLYRTEDFRRYAEEYGWDGGHYAYGYSVWNHWVMGAVAGAEALYDRLLAIAESSFDPQAVPLALTFGMACAHGRRDAEAARQRAERLIAIGTEQRLYLLVAIGQCGRGLAVALQGAHTEGIAELSQGLTLIRMGGARTLTSYYLTYLASAHLEAAQIEEGLAATDEGLALCRQDIARMHEPELLRLEGELLHLRGDAAGALERWRRAVDSARATKAAMWELRAAVSLARFLAERGDHAQAHELLAPIVERFDRTEDFPDIRAARGLL